MNKKKDYGCMEKGVVQMMTWSEGDTRGRVSWTEGDIRGRGTKDGVGQE